MKLNALEFALMNNPVRAMSQRYIETPLLIGPDGHSPESGCWRSAAGAA